VENLAAVVMFLVPVVWMGLPVLDVVERRRARRLPVGNLSAFRG
jgi:hypothetical protein